MGGLGRISLLRRNGKLALRRNEIGAEAKMGMTSEAKLWVGINAEASMGFGWICGTRYSEKNRTKAYRRIGEVSNSVKECGGMGMLSEYRVYPAPVLQLLELDYYVRKRTSVRNGQGMYVI